MESEDKHSGIMDLVMKSYKKGGEDVCESLVEAFLALQGHGFNALEMGQIVEMIEAAKKKL